MAAVGAIRSKPFATLWPTNGLAAVKATTSSSEANSESQPWSETISLESARDRVLGTFELLDNILCHLPWNELFIIRRVASSWNAVVGRSPSVQVEMSLLSRSPPKHPASDCYSFGGQQLITETCYRAPNCPKTSPLTPTSQRANLQWYPRAIFGKQWTVSDVSSPAQFKLDIAGYMGKRDSGSSWRSMLLTWNPPVTAVDLAILPNKLERSIPSKITVYNPSGVRLGELYDWIWELCGEFQKTTGGSASGLLASISFCLMPSRR